MGSLIRLRLIRLRMLGLPCLRCLPLVRLSLYARPELYATHNILENKYKRQAYRSSRARWRGRGPNSRRIQRSSSVQTIKLNATTNAKQIKRKAQTPKSRDNPEPWEAPYTSDSDEDSTGSNKENIDPMNEPYQVVREMTNSLSKLLS